VSARMAQQQQHICAAFPIDIIRAFVIGLEE
jgi:hypothetical protein